MRWARAFETSANVCGDIHALRRQSRRFIVSVLFPECFLPEMTMAESAPHAGSASTPRQALRIRPAWAVASVLLLIIAVPLALWQAPFPRPEQSFGERNVLEMLWYPIDADRGSNHRADTQ
jgi:hypothetical protein